MRENKRVARLEKLGCNLLQLQVAWQVRNQTVQSTTISACTPDALMELLHSLTVNSSAKSMMQL